MGEYPPPGFEEVNFATYFFSRDKMPINMNMLVFFLGKCVRSAAKPMVVDGENQKALSLLYLASGPLPNAANSRVAPTEFAAGPGDNKDEVLEGKFRNLDFSPSTKRQLGVLLDFFFPFVDI